MKCLPHVCIAATSGPLCMIPRVVNYACVSLQGRGS